MLLYCRKKYRREGRARRNEEKAERKRKFLSSSDEEDERDKKKEKKRPKGDERENSGYDPISKLKLKREEERKTKKESKEKKRDVGGAAHEKTKTHSGYNFNYGRSNNNVGNSDPKGSQFLDSVKSETKQHDYSQAFVGKIAGMDGKPKPKNKDKVGFYSSSGSDKNKNSNGPKNNNEEGTGKLIQNPLFCGQGRSTDDLLVVNGLHDTSYFSSSFPERNTFAVKLSFDASTSSPSPHKCEKSATQNATHVPNDVAKL